MPNEILASPSPLRIATGVEGSLEVGGSVTIPGVPTGFIPAEYEISGNIEMDNTPSLTRINKVSGSTLNDSYVRSIATYRREQPFELNGNVVEPIATRQAILIGLRDNRGVDSNVYAYSNNISDHWHCDVTIFGQVLVVGKEIHDGDNLAFYNDGSSIIFKREHDHIWSNEYSLPIPGDVTDFRFLYNLELAGNWLRHTLRRIDIATIPLGTGNLTYTLDPPNSAQVRAIDGTHFGITAESVGNFNIILSHPDVTVDLVVPVEVAALYLNPVGLNCGGSVIAGTIVQFQSNGGVGGLFEASGGTILSDLRWQAPFETGTVVFTYTIGTVRATCTLNVVQKLTVHGVDEDGNYPDMAQGEVVFFYSSCLHAAYSSPNYPNLITLNGSLTAPTDADDDVFGQKDVIVNVSGCGQTYQFKVRIQAMYPTPRFCGPNPEKFLPIRTDFKANTLEFDGGTTQVKNRTGEGIRVWNVNYRLLLMQPRVCTCSENGRCETSLGTAMRLDAFYNQVKFTNYFTMVDRHTGIQYKYVRLVSFTNDHLDYKTEQVRSLSMRWAGNPLAI